MRETDRGWPGIDNVSPNTHARFVRHATRGRIRGGGHFFFFSREITHGNDTKIKCVYERRRWQRTAVVPIFHVHKNPIRLE